MAESSRPKLLFETGNPIRYYLPFAMWTWADSNSVTPSPNAPTRATGCTGTSPSTVSGLPMPRGACRTRCPKDSPPPSTSASTRTRSTSRSTANTSPTDQARQPPPPPTVPTRQIRRRPL
ncbi:MAG: hypothetical protein H0U22_11055 [Geodermatophilaceae bacterium]|nr:hypothetical protein [Geodermatophilaceae bacterium]